MLRKKLVIVTLIFATFTMTSCIGMFVKNSVKDSKIGNKFLLHSNPRVGDFAIWKGTDGHTEVKNRIIARRGALFIVKVETNMIIPNIGSHNILTLELYVTRRGLVRQAYLIDGNERTKLQIAKKGDLEYQKVVHLTAKQKRTYEIPRRVTVTAGTYNVRNEAFQSKKNKKETVVVYLTNPSVKFRYVSAITFYKNSDGSLSKHEAFELSNQGRER